MADTVWTPKSLDELRTALEQGVLTEGHHLDFKRELTEGAAANKAIAKDLAAFANDGGRLVIGVEESGSTFTVRPVPLSQLKERIDQIARSLLTPPLQVRCIDLVELSDPAVGCLVVEIPASPEAPHQTGDRMWGRSDTTSYVLPQVEVVAMFERRVRDRADVNALLDEEIKRDPWHDQVIAENAHLFVVAEPVGHDDELFLGALGDRTFDAWLQAEVVPHLHKDHLFSPSLRSSATQTSRRARGWARHNYCIGPGREVIPNGNAPAREEGMLDLEVRENGGVALFCGRASDILNGSQLIDAAVAGLVVTTVETVLAVTRSTGFQGSWQIGAAVTELRGATSLAASQYGGDLVETAYSEDTYRRTLTVTSLAVEDDPVGVAGRLVDPLLRAVRSPHVVHSLRPDP